MRLASRVPVVQTRSSSTFAFPSGQARFARSLTDGETTAPSTRRPWSGRRSRLATLVNPFGITSLNVDPSGTPSVRGLPTRRDVRLTFRSSTLGLAHGVLAPTVRPLTLRPIPWTALGAGRSHPQGHTLSLLERGGYLSHRHRSLTVTCSTPRCDAFQPQLSRFTTWRRTCVNLVSRTQPSGWLFDISAP